jgi:hypothetical protein
MSVRLILIAMIGVVSATAVAAQPARGRPQVALPAAPTPPVVLASAIDMPRQSPTAADRPSEHERRPAPRVTTCRCADQQPTEQQPDQ